MADPVRMGDGGGPHARLHRLAGGAMSESRERNDAVFARHPAARSASEAEAPADALDVETLALAKFHDDNPNDPDVWGLLGDAGREQYRKWARRVIERYRAILAEGQP